MDLLSQVFQGTFSMIREIRVAGTRIETMPGIYKSTVVIFEPLVSEFNYE